MTYLAQRWTFLQTVFEIFRKFTYFCLSIRLPTECSPFSCFSSWRSLHSCTVLRSNFDVKELFVPALESRFLHIQTNLHKMILEKKPNAYTDFPESNGLQIKCKRFLTKCIYIQSILVIFPEWRLSYVLLTTFKIYNPFSVFWLFYLIILLSINETLCGNSRLCLLRFSDSLCLHYEKTNKFSYV